MWEQFYILEGVYKRYKSIVESKKWQAITLIVVYIIGIILGLIFFSEREKVLFCDNTIDFLVYALCKSSSPISLFFTRVLNSLWVFVFFSLTALTVYLCPLHYVIVAYRGYVLGAASIIFITNFKITGIVLFIFCVFLQNLITTLSLILYSTISCKLAKSFLSCKKFNYKSYASTCLIFYGISIIGALFELIMLVFIFRPLNFYF